MSFPAEAPTCLPFGLKTGDPLPRLVAPGIVVGDPSRLGAGEPAYTQIGLTHVLTRPEGSAQLPQDGSVTFLIILPHHTLRHVVEFLVQLRVSEPYGKVLIGEPFVATAYLMSIEKKGLYSTWRLVTGESLTRKLFKSVHEVLGPFAKDMDEEGKRVEREAGEEWHRRFQADIFLQYQQIQLQRRRQQQQMQLQQQLQEQKQQKPLRKRARQ
ncbi:hypothetical protein B0F90DRAFT_276669 [Multifurca ochricompacta]|uniref:Uncharacterized protein n=1 Tax=Multifurca ochricompacta TaxID=376703 RepID=A0AAD4LXQ9_9AGAM|nr:hypothetical protein B0F90DRAFT_276669 [Multifurca ochricompacta]